MQTRSIDTFAQFYSMVVLAYGIREYHRECTNCAHYMHPRARARAGRLGAEKAGVPAHWLGLGLGLGVTQAQAWAKAYNS